MQNIKNDQPRQEALTAIRNFLQCPIRLKNFNLTDITVDLMGGADGCVMNAYDHRDTCDEILEVLRGNLTKVGVHSREDAIGLISNLREFFDHVTREEDIQAELTEYTVSHYGLGSSDKYYLNLKRQYELKTQLLVLQHEAREIDTSAEKKAA